MLSKLTAVLQSFAQTQQLNWKLHQWRGKCGRQLGDPPPSNEATGVLWSVQAQRYNDLMRKQSLCRCRRKGHQGSSEHSQDA